jgi:hypothetical protein
MDNFCSEYEYRYYGADYVYCYVGGNFGPWTGGYAFPTMNEQDALGVASELCWEQFQACNDTCYSQEYAEYKAAEWTWASGGTCQYDPSCVGAFSYPSCQTGTSGSFSCVCSAINLCMPCE